MAIDYNLILGGQAPDIVGSMARGNALAGQVMQQDQARQTRDLYKTQGAGISMGDPNALNALAQLDPAASMDLRATKQRMDIMTAEEQRAIQDFAAKATAQQKAEAVQKIEDAVKMGTAIQDPQTWDQVMSREAPELVGQFAMRDALARKYMTMAEAIKAAQGPSPTDRYKVVGGTLMDLSAGGGPKPIYNAPQPTETIFGPDGQPILQRGGPAGVKFTEGQSKDVVYATRARGALESLESILTQNPDALSSRTGPLLENVPMGLGRDLQSDAYQVAKTYGDEFLQAVLRKDTGAAITTDEQRLYGDTYLPRAGDGKAKLAAKKAARARALAAIEAGMNIDQIAAQDRALVLQFSESQGQNSPATIQNDAEYDALPSGTEFVGPDGVKRRKP